ncbi:MAG: hypothetical protein WBK91_00060 [Alphaproteobacteria bacterium]
MAIDSPRPDYSAARPIIEHIGADERTLIQSGAWQLFNYVLDNDPRFNADPKAQSLKKLMRSQQVLPVMRDFVLSVTAGDTVKKKNAEEEKQEKEKTEEGLKRLNLMLQVGTDVAGAFKTTGKRNGQNYADYIYDLATNLDNPASRRQLIEEALRKTKEFQAQSQADKSPEGMARRSAMETKLATGITDATKDGIKGSVQGSGIIARWTAKAGNLGAHFGKHAAAGGPLGALAGLGLSSVSAGLLFASSYATTGDAEQSVRDAVGAVVPVDAVLALTKGDYNSGAANLANFYIPGIGNVAHYALKKINPENSPDLFLNIGGRMVSAGVHAGLRKGEAFLGLHPEDS